MTPPLCQSCGKNPATFHLTEIAKDGSRRTLHLCEACANEQEPLGGPGVQAVLANLVQSYLEGREGGGATRCPHCGITYDEFRTKGRFGCPRDYEVFEDKLDALLDKWHGAHQHTGRLPRGRRAVDTGVPDRLLRLRHELQEAVRVEAYESAARIRDEIRALEGREAETGETGGEAGGGPR